MSDRADGPTNLPVMDTHQNPNRAGNPGDNPAQKPKPKEVITVRLPKGTLMEFDQTSHAVVRAALAGRRQGGRALWLKCISPKYPDFYGAIFESAPTEPSAMLPLPLHAPSPRMEQMPEEPKKPASTPPAVPPAVPSQPPKPAQPRKKPNGPEIA